MNTTAFETICRMSQEKLKEHVTKQLQKSYDTVISEDGFVYAQGEIPILLVAHLDTVHEKLPDIIHYDTIKHIISSPQGIGGDDRCGIYMILEIIKKHNCSVLFCEDEEIGCVGASKFIKTKLAKKLIGTFNYIIELDRKGNNDAVFYDCDNKEFEDFITKDFYKTNYGIYSDISEIAPFLECAAVNLSCGYYNAHTEKEYVILPEMETSIKETMKILERTRVTDTFEYIEAMHDDYYGGYYSYGFNDDYKEKYYLITYMTKNGEIDACEVVARSDEEAIGIFAVEHPNRTFEDVIDFCKDEF